MEPHHYPFLFIALIAVLAPLINELPRRFRMPSVVLEMAGGVVVGPQVLGLVRADAAIEMIWGIGICFLFLLAGMEIDFDRLRGRPLRLAAWGWALSLALALGTAWLLQALGLIQTPVLIALALTTTAIGTLLPILRDAGELSRDFGVLTLGAGAAVGEFGPLFMLSLVPLEGQTVSGNTLGIVGFAVVATLAALLVLYVQPPKFLEILSGACTRPASSLCAWRCCWWASSPSSRESSGLIFSSVPLPRG